MAEENIDHDELLLMRHLDGRLSALEASALKGRLLREPDLSERLQALELENDLIATAVAVPEDVELPEPVMMAIIDQALKDPKRKTVERRWWKPVTFAVGAAAAVVLAVLSSYLVGVGDPQILNVGGLLPDATRVTATPETADATGVGSATLLTNGSQIVPGTTLSSSGSASLTLLEGITLHFDSNTQVKLIEARAHRPVVFELIKGALIAEYNLKASTGGKAGVKSSAEAAPGIIIKTGDKQCQVDLNQGRVLIQPLGGRGVGGSGNTGTLATYLIYTPDGKGTVSQPNAAAAGHATVNPVALADGTQVVWPSAPAQTRVVHSDTLVCDLLCGWQFEHAHAPGKWWTHELRYDGLDSAWPTDWAKEIAETLNAPNFLKQALALADTLNADGSLKEQAGTGDEVLNRWLDMGNTLSDNAMYQQLDPARRLTWDLLTVKANLLAYQAARIAARTSQSKSGTDLPLRRINQTLLSLEDQASRVADNQRLKTGVTYLRMESNLLDETVAFKRIACYGKFSTEFPTSLESMALQLKMALQESSGDSRIRQLNLAWQDCHSFQARMESKWDDQPAALVRLQQIRAEILGALAEEFYAQQQPVEAEQIIGSLEFLGFDQVRDAAGQPVGAGLIERLVERDLARAEEERLAGRADGMELLLELPSVVSHLPSELQKALPASAVATSRASAYTVSHEMAERWAQAYAGWLKLAQKKDELHKFQEQAKEFLPAPAQTRPEAPEILPAAAEAIRETVAP